MESSVQCYMVRVMVTPDLMGRLFVETNFLAKSDQDAVKDSFCHAQALVRIYGLRVDRIEVFDCHLGTMLEGVSQGGIDRMLYDSEKLDDGILQERPDFIG
jgi:hypothetical protein